MYIAIAGNIGSGKTTLTELLVKQYGWVPHYEKVATNPYINDYYAAMQRWALNMEIFFLKERFRDLLAINRSEKIIVQDRSIYEGVHVFAATNYELGNIDDRDYDTFKGLFESMMMVVKQPDLMIYLKSGVPHLVENIRKRGRLYEQDMQIDYLTRINEKYDTFINELYKGPVLTIDVDNMDFLNNRDDRRILFSKVDSAVRETTGYGSLFAAQP